MSFSVLSFLNAVFWFNLGLIPIAILQTRWKIAMKYSPSLLVALAILAGVRVFFPLDSPMFLVVNSRVVLRSLQRVLEMKFGVVSVWMVVVSAWVLGGSIVLIREMSHFLQDRRTRRSWVHVHNDQVVRAAEYLNIPLEEIIVSPQVGTPTVFGLLRPHIYLPDVDLPQEEWVWILKHEYQHILSRDIWIKFLYLILEAVCFWNPLMYKLTKKLSDLLEFRCDYFVTRNNSEDENQVYLLSILHTLQKVKAKEKAPPAKLRSYMCTSLVRTQADLLLEERVNAVESRRRKHPLRDAAILLVSVSLFIASYFVLFQPAVDHPVEDVDGYVEITSKNAYIIRTDEGEYELWVDDCFFVDLSEEEIRVSPMNQLTIREEED